MKQNLCSTLLLMLVVLSSSYAGNGEAADKYTAVIDQRAAKIVQAIGLSDTNAAVAVHELIMDQYRALSEWHSVNDPKIKAAKHDPAALAGIRSTLQAMHDKYLAALAKYLNPDQIERVKDAMTYGKVQFTFAGYRAQYPNLSEANQQEILRLLKEAREEAMDAGSAKEKTAVFQRYKGKINNYLSKQGITPAKKP